MLIEVLEENVRKERAELDYCEDRLTAKDVPSRRRAVRRAHARLVEAEVALRYEWGDVEDDNSVCADCGQGYDSDARDNCPQCGYEYRYEKCEGVADDAGS